jgi:undecaprenyl diphosphate synthase
VLPSSFVKESALPTGSRALHVALIMDGNGRWAARRGRPRSTGHIAGARTARQVVEAAVGLGVGTLTLYAFSGDNWRRPANEVAGLMRLFRRYLAIETARCVTNGVRLTVIGRRDRLSRALQRSIEAAEAETAACTRLHLRVALDYSARDAIVAAAERALATADRPGLALSRERFAELLGEACHSPGAAPDVDVLVRTGGEQRLSDFLLWECAYAELVFSPVLWPDFGAPELAAALGEFGRRERRFGGVLSAAG